MPPRPGPPHQGAGYPTEFITVGRGINRRERGRHSPRSPTTRRIAASLPMPDSFPTNRAPPGTSVLQGRGIYTGPRKITDERRNEPMGASQILAALERHASRGKRGEVSPTTWRRMVSRNAPLLHRKGSWEGGIRGRRSGMARKRAKRKDHAAGFITMDLTATIVAPPQPTRRGIATEGRDLIAPQGSSPARARTSSAHQ